MFALPFALALLATDAPLDLAQLDAAIASCNKELTLPFFSGEGDRRSRFLTDIYAEQAAINRERSEVLSRRRAAREGNGTVDADRALSLAQLALDDRQRLLDDRRRLEALRQEAVDLKRQHYLTRCARGGKD